MLWFNMFLVLKSRRLLLSGNDYPHSEKELLNFKVPFGFVLLFAAGLVLAVWGSELGSVNYEALGTTIIKCLGIFYFFQGFGVFRDSLPDAKRDVYLRIYGACDKVFASRMETLHGRDYGGSGCDPLASGCIKYDVCLDSDDISIRAGYYCS
jgi:hypothetical protein